MSSNIGVWVPSEVKAKLDELLHNNKNGYSDEYLANDRISRFRTILTSTTMSRLSQELLMLGLMVLENNMKDASGKHKVDMTAFYEELLFNVMFSRNLLERATEAGNLDSDKDEIQKRMNRMFRGDTDKYD